MIELSVGLPMLRSRKIAWIALESLANQENTHNFEWELIVFEEENERYEPFGQKAVMAYRDRLYEINCKRIIYVPVKKWMCLGRKWFAIIQRASKTSKIFCLQGADDYTQPYRLSETYKAFTDSDFKIDWVQYQRGLFYNISDGGLALYIRSKTSGKKTAMNIGIKMSLMRKIPCKEVRRHLDSWLYTTTTSIKKLPLNIHWYSGDNWKYGLYTSGYNNISLTRGNMVSELKHPFYKCTLKVNDIVPSHVVNRLLRLKKELANERKG